MCAVGGKSGIRQGQGVCWWGERQYVKSCVSVFVSTFRLAGDAQEQAQIHTKKSYYICPWETSESFYFWACVFKQRDRKTGKETEQKGRCKRWKTLNRDIVLILCKGVAQDNRLSSDWRTQRGLQLIAGCDKQRGEELKPSRQNYAS